MYPRIISTIIITIIVVPNPAIDGKFLRFGGFFFRFLFFFFASRFRTFTGRVCFSPPPPTTSALLPARGKSRKILVVMFVRLPRITDIVRRPYELPPGFYFFLFLKNHYNLCEFTAGPSNFTRDAFSDLVGGSPNSRQEKNVQIHRGGFVVFRFFHHCVVTRSKMTAEDLKCSQNTTIRPLLPRRNIQNVCFRSRFKIFFFFSNKSNTRVELMTKLKKRNSYGQCNCSVL